MFKSSWQGKYGREPHTLEQLPETAEEYYRSSIESVLFKYDLLHKDDLGRKVYQPMYDGELWGEPRALLGYAEYTRAVKRAAKVLGSHIGVQRWSTPFYSNITPPR